jgi:Glycosyl hydrolase catalytic core
MIGSMFGSVIGSKLGSRPTIGSNRGQGLHRSLAIGLLVWCGCGASSGGDGTATGGSPVNVVGGGGGATVGATGGVVGPSAGGSGPGNGSTGGGSGTGGMSGGGGRASGGATSAGGAGAATVAGSPYRGVANSSCAARTALKVSWYFNWLEGANQPCSSASVGGEFVPMIWGHTGAEQSATGIASAITTFVGRGNKYVLGFNEPDNAGQSRIAVATAISLWPSFGNPAISIGSPASQANTTGVAWFSSFMSQVNANPALRTDFIAMHWYGWNAGSCDANASTLESYLRQIEAIPGNRAIWLTEWGCLNLSAPDNATTQAHVAGAIKMFARHPRLVRYAWYPWAGATHTLNNADGSLTPLGVIYAAAPSTH